MGGQVTIHAGGAAAIPVSGFADVAEVGYRALVGGTVDLSDGRAALGATGFYGSNPHQVGDARSDLYGLSVLAGYRFAEAYGARLTGWAGLGGAVHARRSSTFPGLDASRRGLLVSGGASVSRPVGRVVVFVSAFYARGLGDLSTRSYPTEFVTIGGGLGIPLGID